MYNWASESYSLAQFLLLHFVLVFFKLVTQFGDFVFQFYNWFAGFVVFRLKPGNLCDGLVDFAVRGNLVQTWLSVPMPMLNRLALRLEVVAFLLRRR